MRNFIQSPIRTGICALAGILACCGVVSSAHAEESGTGERRLEDSPRHHEWVNIQTEQGRTVRAFVVFPETDKRVPAVLVIHENRGLTDWVRSAADQVAEAGYVALAPDLLSGSGPDKGGTASFPSSDAARDAIYQLPDQQVLDDLDACFKYLKEHPAANGKVAVAGFCWGGSQTFRYAAHNSDIAAAFVFYGSAPTEEGTLKKIEAPVYGFYGGDDFRVTGKVPETEELMKKLDKKYMPITYEGAGHAFMRSGEGPDAKPANREAREQAWRRLKTLLEEL